MDSLYQQTVTSELQRAVLLANPDLKRLHTNAFSPL